MAKIPNKKPLKKPTKPNKEVTKKKPTAVTNTNINNVIASIYDTRWTYANQFDITIGLPAGASGDTGTLDNHVMFNTAIKTFTIPDYTTSPIETYVGGSWTYTTGIKEIQKIDMTFRDFNDFYLHRTFTHLLNSMRDMFPAQQFWHITIRTAKGGTVIYQTSKAILDAVSNIALDRSNESQIGEFSVSFKSS